MTRAWDKESKSESGVREAMGSIPVGDLDFFRLKKNTY